MYISQKPSKFSFRHHFIWQFFDDFGPRWIFSSSSVSAQKCSNNHKILFFSPRLMSRSGKGRIPVVSDSGSLRKGLLSLFDTVSHCVVTLKDKVDQNSGYYHDNHLYYQDYNNTNYDSDELDYSGGLRRKEKLRPFNKRAYYKINIEYPTQPGYGVNRGPQAAKGGYISRSKVWILISDIFHGVKSIIFYDIQSM